MILLKNEWEVKPIDLNACKTFVEEWHYANGIGDVAQFKFGLFYKGDTTTLHGVAMWNPPPFGAAKAYCVNGYHQGVLGLTRFCLRDDRPENSGSFLIGKSIKLLDKRRYNMLCTYADTCENHTGGLYRASNWSYKGLSKKNPRYQDPVNNRMVSKKSGKNNYSKQDMLDKGYVFMGNFAKHIFLYPFARRKITSTCEGTQLDLVFTAKGKICIDGFASPVIN